MFSVRNQKDLITVSGNLPNKDEAAVFAAGDLVSDNIIVLSGIFNSYRGQAEIESIRIFELKDAGAYQGGDGRILIFNNPSFELEVSSTRLDSNDPFLLGDNHDYSNMLTFPFVDGDWIIAENTTTGKLQSNKLDLTKSASGNIIQVASDIEYNLALAWVTDGTPTYPDDNNELYYEIIMRKHYGISPNE